MASKLTNGINKIKQSDVRRILGDFALQLDLVLDLANSATASAVNTLQLVSSTGTTALQLKAGGTATNLAINIVPKGTGSVVLMGQNSAATLTAASATTQVNGVTVTGSATGTLVSIAASGTDSNIPLQMQPKGTSAFSVLGQNSAATLTAASATTQVNGLTVTGSATGATVSVAPTGTDSNIPLTIAAKGTSDVLVLGQNSANTLQLTSATTQVNGLKITGSAAGSAVLVAAVGTDTDIDLNLAPKGAGMLKGGTAGCFIANAAVATAMSSVGPTGSHTTIQKWLQIKDNSGTTLFIPCF